MSISADVTNLKGLTEEEVEQRLREEGCNEIVGSRKRSTLEIAFSVVREPMFLLLVACGALYLALGDPQEAAMLLGFVFIVMGITLYQERKTERALEALRDMSSPRALVVRGGRQVMISGRDVVRDDILILAEGNRVPADAAVLESTNLMVNESLLTGESVPVRKSVWDGRSDLGRPGGDGSPCIYSGTLIVKGQGVARVHATGMRTEMGKIGRSLQEVQSGDTALQRETRGIVRTIAIGGASLCALVVAVYGLRSGQWLEGLLAGLALAMALLPEEFPVVLTIFLALGAWRISKRHVLTRRIPAVENLGAATVLCVDKTGTLTQNQMTVQRIYARGEFCDVGGRREDALPDSMHELMEFGILACHREPFDPMETAIRRLGQDTLTDTEHWHPEWTLIQQYPLSEQLLAMSHAWVPAGQDELVVAAKGAPEAIADLCHLDAEASAGITQVAGIMADDGLRVLGVAKATLKGPTLPSQQHDFEFEFVGLVGLADPIRPAVPDAVRECYGAGIRVVMITGDYPGTARSIACQIGLQPMDEIITGPELDGMSDAELERRIHAVNIFARVVPEQKLRIVRALRANGEVVAMTGDGVNDAPALKASDIGIAMGSRGTDVAREAADLVLLQDDFSSIVDAVRLGRRIFENLRKAMAYILAIHVPIAGMSLIPVLLSLPFVLHPVHIVLLELIIDPACSVVFEAEPEDAGLMRRRPRKVGERIIRPRVLALSMAQGLFVLFIVAAVFGFALRAGKGEADARALSFVTLVLANLGLIFTNRSWTRTIFVNMRTPNGALWWVTAGALAFLALVLYTPGLSGLFHFAPLHFYDLALCVACAGVSILWFEAFKLVRR